MSKSSNVKRGADSQQRMVRPTGPQDVGYWWTRPADDCLWRIVEITHFEHTMLIQEMGDEESDIFIEIPHWQWSGPIAPPVGRTTPP